jgi:hypothetical protein
MSWRLAFGAWRLEFGACVCRLQKVRADVQYNKPAHLSFYLHYRS